MEQVLGIVDFAKWALIHTFPIIGLQIARILQSVPTISVQVVPNLEN